MSSEDIFWKAFEKSGNMGYYLLYKKVKKENDERNDKGNSDPGDGLSGER